MAVKTEPDSEPVRRLVRSRSDRMLGGVCGGIAEALDIPSAAVRLACVLLTFFSGWTALMYAVALAVMPAEPRKTQDETRTKAGPPVGSVWGFILVCLGLLLLSGWISDQWEWWGGPFGGFWRWHPLPFRILFPILIILTGIGLWSRSLAGSAENRKPAGQKGSSGTAWSRSRTDRVISGVCGGLAERFRIDPTLVRLLAVLLSLITALFPGLFFYLCLWIVIPEKH
jgi:phage shock protein C